MFQKAENRGCKSEKNGGGYDLVCVNSVKKFGRNLLRQFCLIESPENAIFKVCRIFIGFFLVLMMGLRIDAHNSCCSLNSAEEARCLFSQARNYGRRLALAYVGSAQFEVAVGEIVVFQLCPFL